MKKAEEIALIQHEIEEHDRRKSDMLPATFRYARRLGGISVMAAVAPLAAYSAARAERGEKLSAAVGTSAFAFLQPALAATFAVGLPAGIGWAAAPLLALYPAYQLSGMASRQFRKFSKTAREVQRLEMGGDYRDSYSAYASRMQAMQDMTGTFQSARRWLGQEGRMMHR